MITFEQNLELAPMKYWAPTRGSTLTTDILENPLKYNNYSYTIKVDGEWNKLAWDGEHMYMLSRNKNVQGVYTDRAEKVPHLVESISKLIPPNTIFLGELAFEDLTKTSRDVGSIMRSLPPKAIKRQEERGKLHFFIFDCLMYDGEDLSGLSYEDRFIKKELFYGNVLVGSPYVSVLVNQPMETLPQRFAEVIQQGGEGVVLIKKDEPYHFGKRPARSSIKIKKQLEEFEAKVIAALDPKKNYEGTEIDTWEYWDDDIAVTKPYYYGWKNAIRCEYDGRVFDVASGLSDEDREWLASLDATQAIDEGVLYAVVGGMELTEDSVRHPYLVRLRSDI